MELAAPRRGLALDSAQTILNMLKLHDAPIDPECVIKTLKYKLVEVALPDNVDGLTMMHRGSYLVFVNEQLSLAHKRFTMAHELGHIVLGHLAHSHTSRQTDRMMDKEANWFAAELLMPRELFVSALSATRVGSEYLAERFGLATDLVQMRLSQLGLTTDPLESAVDPFEATYPHVR